MKKLLFTTLLLLLFTSCKTQFSSLATAQLPNESESEELAGNFENQLHEKQNDTLSKVVALEKKKPTTILNSRINPVLLKNYLKRRLAKNENLEREMDLFIKRAHIIENAKTYLGTKYYFGGMCEKGIDCSALVLKAFENNDILVPRTSRAQAELGIEVGLKKADIGDLIFFKTTRRNVISHVGIVVENYQGEIKFIHASSSQGVTITSLENSYFKKRFVEIKRIIN